MIYNKYSQYIYEKYYRYDYMVNKFVEMQKFFDANYLGVTNYYGIKEFFATIYEGGVLDILKRTNGYCETKNNIALDFAEELKTEKEIEAELDEVIVKIQKDMPSLTNYYNEALKLIQENKENVYNSNTTKNKSYFSKQIEEVDAIIDEVSNLDENEEFIKKLNVAKEDLNMLETFINDNEEQREQLNAEADKIVDKMKKEQRKFKNSLVEKMII